MNFALIIAWELANYFVTQSYRVYAEFKKENKDDLLAFALSRFQERESEEWEGTATELFDALVELGSSRPFLRSPTHLPRVG